MASDPIALPALDCVWNDFSPQIECTAIYTQPDRRRGRGRQLTLNPIKQWALDRDLRVMQPQRMDREAIATFEALQCDLVIVMAYGHLLPRRMLTMARRGFVNLHASLLPKLRGASPVETAIVTGESQTGVTLMRIAPELDSGPILDVESIDIKENETGVSLRQRLSAACVPLLQRSLPSLLDGSAIASEQCHEEASYCRLIDKDDGWLDFSLSTLELLRHIRGFQAWPGALFEWQGVTYRIGEGCVGSHETPLHPGLLLRGRRQLHIGTRDGWLEVLQIQKPGGKMMAVSDFLNGCNLPERAPLSFPKRFPLVASHPFRKPAGPTSDGKS
ncbi:MAG: methionyl-tRNA formyltransferase [Puniceicoccaceae bacterium]